MTKNHLISLVLLLGLGLVAPQFVHATTSCSQTSQKSNAGRQVQDVITKEIVEKNDDGSFTTKKILIIIYDDGSYEVTTYVHNPKPDTFGVTV